MRTLVLGLVFVLAACGGDDSSNPFPSATNQGGANNVDAGDASVATVDSAPPTAMSCGSKSCKSGEYCCDGKCGACAAIGTLCPAKPCP